MEAPAYIEDRDDAAMDVNDTCYNIRRIRQWSHLNNREDPFHAGNREGIPLLIKWKMRRYVALFTR